MTNEAPTPPSPVPNAERKKPLIDIEYIELSSEGQRMQGKIFYPETQKEKNPTLLFVHGWMGDQSGNASYAAEAAEHGFIGMTFNLRGHGTSSGDREVLTYENFMQDVRAAYDALAHTPGVDPEDITVIGTSFGSYLAALLAEEKKVANLVLRVPANYPDGNFEKSVASLAGTKELAQWREEPLDSKATRALNSVHDFGGNVLIIESEHDTFVPHQTVENYRNAVRDETKLEYVLMKGAPHSLNTPELWKQYQDILLKWLAELHPAKQP